MFERILGVSIGLALLFAILFLRGLPVLIFLKMIPLILLLFVAIAFIYAGISSD